MALDALRGIDAVPPTEDIWPIVITIIVIVVVLLLLAVGGFFGWRYVTSRRNAASSSPTPATSVLASSEPQLDTVTMFPADAGTTTTLEDMDTGSTGKKSRGSRRKSKRHSGKQPVVYDNVIVEGEAGTIGVASNDELMEIEQEGGMPTTPTSTTVIEPLSDAPPPAEDMSVAVAAADEGESDNDVPPATSATIDGSTMTAEQLFDAFSAGSLTQDEYDAAKEKLGAAE